MYGSESSSSLPCVQCPLLNGVMATLIKGFVSQFESMEEFLACSKLDWCMVRKLVIAAFKAPSPSSYICYLSRPKLISKSNELSLPPKQAYP